MPSVSGMIEVITKLESPFVTVRQDRCVLVRNRNAGCLRCAEACTSGCIAFDGERVTVEPENCVGCGTCATACPSGALEAHHPDDAALLAACGESARQLGGSVCIACGVMLDRAQGLYDRDKAVRVECLGRVEESLLTALAARGVARVVLVHGECGTCGRAAGRAMLDAVLASERELLSAWHVGMATVTSGKLPGVTRAVDEGYDKSKRALLEQAGRESVRVGMAAIDIAAHDALGSRDAARKGAIPGEEPPWRTYAKVTDDGALPHAVPDRRMNLLDSLASLEDPEDVMVATRMWGHVIIDVDKCSSCRMCATFCPTGALAGFEEGDGTFGVRHYPGLCVKCRCCERICPVSALEISEEVFAVDMLAGETDRYVMRPRSVRLGQPSSMLNAMRAVSGAPQVYEVGDYNA